MLSCISTVHFFFIPQVAFHCMDRHNLSIHLSMNLWIVFSFGLLQIKCCEHLCISHRMDICFHFS